MAKEKLYFKRLGSVLDWDVTIPKSWRKGRTQRVWVILHCIWVKAKRELEKANNLQYLGFGSKDFSGAEFICPSQKVARRTKALLIHKARTESQLGVEIAERRYTIGGIFHQLMSARPDEVFIYEENPLKGEKYLIIENE